MTCVCLIITVSFGLFFGINKFGNHILAKTFYFLFCIPVITLLDWMLPGNCGLLLYYIPLVLVILILHDYYQNKTIIFIYLTVIGLSYIFFNFLINQDNLLKFSSTKINLLYEINFFCSLVITFLEGYYFMQLNSNAEKKLLETQAKLKDVFETSLASIFYIDRDEKLQLFNQRAAKEVKQTLNIELKEDTSIYQFLPENSHENFRINLARAFNGETFKYEREIDSPIGKLYYESSFAPILNNSEIIGVITKGLNITDQRLMEEKLKNRSMLLQTIFDASPDSLLLVDENTNQVISFNKVALLKFNLVVDYQFNFKELFENGQDAKFWGKIFSYLESNELVNFEMTCISNDNKNFLGEVLIKKFELQSVPHLLIRITDITKKTLERENQIAFLKMKKQASEDKLKQKNLALLINGQETERHRISMELHDGVGQMLTATRLQILALNNKNEQFFESDKKIATILIDNVISEIKRVSHNLMPSGMEDLGLIAALENTFSLYPSDVTINFDYDYSIIELTLTKNQRIALFRITQEAINNAIKHADTKQVNVCLGKTDEESIFIEIYDHGKGFKMDKMIQFYSKRTIGSGLNNMKERASLINAKLEIDSQIGKGTRITVFLSLKK